MAVDTEERDGADAERAELLDRRLADVEIRARVYADAMVTADQASRDLTDALSAAIDLNKDGWIVSEQSVANWANRGIPPEAEAFGRPLPLSLMALRRRTGRATDTRRYRRR